MHYILYIILCIIYIIMLSHLGTGSWSYICRGLNAGDVVSNVYNITYYIHNPYVYNIYVLYCPLGTYRGLGFNV